VSTFNILPGLLDSAHEGTVILPNIRNPTTTTTTTTTTTMTTTKTKNNNNNNNNNNKRSCGC
jgi:hypothetical protein